jgi:hypothetical protein
VLSASKRGELSEFTSRRVCWMSPNRYYTLGGQWQIEEVRFSSRGGTPVAQTDPKFQMNCISGRSREEHDSMCCRKPRATWLVGHMTESTSWNNRDPGVEGWALVSPEHLLAACSWWQGVTENECTTRWRVNCIRQRKVQPRKGKCDRVTCSGRARERGLIFKNGRSREWKGGVVRAQR